MTVKYYHLYADGKTVKEISRAEYLKERKDWLCCHIDDYNIFFCRNRKGIFVPLPQLKQILGEG